MSEIVGKKEAEKPQSSGNPRVATCYVCDCFPQHCEKYEEHGLCWCEPNLSEVEGNKILVQMEEQ